MFIHTYIHNKLEKIVNKFRIWRLKLLGAKVGKNVRVFGRFTVINPSNLTIGNNSTLNEGVLINCREKVFIGKNVRIPSKSQIHTAGLTINKFPRKHYAKPIFIEDSVWIASSAIINPGVRIGKNSVVLPELL